LAVFLENLLPLFPGYRNDVGFEVLAAMVMESTIFWDITLSSVESQPTFRKNISPSSSGSKNKPSKKLATCFHAGFLLALFFDPEDGSDMFLRNVG
jgi:hypothetical protein